VYAKRRRGVVIRNSEPGTVYFSTTFYHCYYSGELFCRFYKLNIYLYLIRQNRRKSYSLSVLTYALDGGNCLAPGRFTGVH
jgi:hypothetical protein